MSIYVSHYLNDRMTLSPFQNSISQLRNTLKIAWWCLQYLISGSSKLLYVLIINFLFSILDVVNEQKPHYHLYAKWGGGTYGAVKTCENYLELNFKHSNVNPNYRYLQSVMSVVMITWALSWFGKKTRLALYFCALVCGG